MVRIASHQSLEGGICLALIISMAVQQNCAQTEPAGHSTERLWGKQSICSWDSPAALPVPPMLVLESRGGRRRAVHAAPAAGSVFAVLFVPSRWGGQGCSPAAASTFPLHGSPRLCRVARTLPCSLWPCQAFPAGWDRRGHGTGQPSPRVQPAHRPRSEPRASSRACIPSSCQRGRGTASNFLAGLRLAPSKGKPKPPRCLPPAEDTTFPRVALGSAAVPFWGFPAAAVPRGSRLRAAPCAWPCCVAVRELTLGLAAAGPTGVRY